jgi:hypothetical protein
MVRLKIIAVIASIAVAGLAYILLSRYFSSEEAFFIGPKPLTRALLVDMKVKSNRDFPTFLPENSGFLVIHSSQSPKDHRKDTVETRDIFNIIAKTNKNIIDSHDELYAKFEILFLKKTLAGLQAKYVTLATLNISSIFFDPNYLLQFSELYQDSLPHAAGHIVMTDSSQRLIHDILVK